MASERHAVVIGSLELDDASREAPAPTTVRIHHVHNAPRWQNGGLRDASAQPFAFHFSLAGSIVGVLLRKGGLMQKING